MDLKIMRKEDVPNIVSTFTFPWTTLSAIQEKWQRYYEEQELHVRTVCVAKKGKQIIGYGSLLRFSKYRNFKNTAEIADVWVLKNYRRYAYESSIIQFLEGVASFDRYKETGIGVGLHKDYGRVQRLCFELGYSPDGKGITYKYKPVEPGVQYPVDDDLVLWFTRDLV